MKIAYPRTSKKFGGFFLYYQKVKWMNASILLSLSFIPLPIPHYSSVSFLNPSFIEPQYPSPYVGKKMKESGKSC